MIPFLLQDLRGTSFIAITIKLLLCLLCGGIIGLERGSHGQAAGFRTHILVCTGACVAMLTGQYIHIDAVNSDPARLGAQVISGIGFLGAGTIVSTHSNKVKGLTTAAGLWVDACIGLAIGIGFYEAAIAGAIVVFLTIVVFRKLDIMFYASSSRYDAYLEVESMSCIAPMIQNLRSYDLKVSHLEVQKPRSGIKNAIGVTVTIQKPNRKSKISIPDVLDETQGILFAENLFIKEQS